MSKHSEITDSLIERFLANLPLIDGQPLSTKNIKYPNANFDTPSNSPWVRLTNNKGRGINVQAGYNATFRTPGSFVIDIFTPKGTGNREANLIANQVDDLYRKQYFDTIRADETQVDEIGIDDSWYHVQVTVFYNYDDC